MTDTHQTELAALDVVTVQLVRERQLLYHNRLTMPEQAVEIFIALVENPDRECFVALMLDTKSRVTSVHLVSQGSLNQSIVHPRETFKSAVLANAAAIILVHNHPSGDLSPSREDTEITRRLKEAGELLGIRVLDHLIVDTESGRYTSFASQGLF